ncbi:MAG: hypothetical protein JSS02_16430 [Planctomycetes bacterium]|nr:hypothetical protein [Planctomycetota bacterium]
MHILRMVSLGLLLGLVFPMAGFGQEGRTKSRLLYSFEAHSEVAELQKAAEKSDLIVVADNGVTHGKNCVRWVARKGASWSTLELGTTARQDWRDFDYFAIDIFIEPEGPTAFTLELWDPLTKGFPTRCTFDGLRLRPGRQTVLVPINRARRNGKEGRDWNELEPKDKIDLAKLTKVKLFLTPPKDRDAVLWIDNLRLLQEDAAKPKLRVPLPKGAVAFKFGSAGESLPGFTTIAPEAKGLVGTGITHGGTGWPDALSGTFVLAPEGERFSFSAPLPNGAYAAWLLAGPIYRRSSANRVFRLKLNGQVVVDESPTLDEYYSEKHLYRFLPVDHDGDPTQLWPDYLARMYPAQQATLEITDGTLRLEAVNHFVSALVLVPQGQGGDFVPPIETARRQAFEKTLPPIKRNWPTRAAGAGPAVAWLPAPGERIWPWSLPRRDKPAAWSLGVAPGQVLHLNLGLTAFVADDVKISCHLPGDATASHFDQRLRFDGDDASEMVLLPADHVRTRPGRTRSLWIQAQVPKTLPAGVHEGTIRLAGAEFQLQIPVRWEVQPITLQEVLPLSLGMYYTPRPIAGLDPVRQRALFKAQFEFMRSVGLTAVPIGSGTITGLPARGQTSVRFDPTFCELAREVGFGRHPRQYQMGTTLGMGRAIGRRLGDLGAAVDRNPGVELKQAGFREHHLDALRQYRAFLEQQKLPVAVEVVDEPREVPNPWNRNLADTLAYAAMVREAGLTGFVTPMSDTNSGKDYSILADQVDILSVHGWKASAKLMARAAEQKRTMWLYNTGMDRFSWGFYAWRVGAVGRWEWHFSWPEDQGRGGYPGREWFNPFTSSHGLASDAPLSYPGGILYQSAFLEVSEGITDYAYLLTLETALGNQQSPQAKEAREFLQGLKKAIPQFPELQGLADPGAGALVGMGIKDEARLQAPAWRARLAQYIAALSK